MIILVKISSFIVTTMSNHVKGMSDNQIRNEYIKILKSAPSRGGQEPPDYIIQEVRTDNIEKVKRKVIKFYRRQTKLSKQKTEKGKRTRKELEKLYIKLSRKHRGKSCYKHYGGKLECTKRPDSDFVWDLKNRFKTMKLLEREVFSLELLDAKSKSRKHKGGKNVDEALLDSGMCMESFLSTKSDNEVNAVNKYRQCRINNGCEKLSMEFHKLKQFELDNCKQRNSDCIKRVLETEEYKKLKEAFLKSNQEKQKICQSKCNNEKKKLEKIHQEYEKIRKKNILYLKTIIRDINNRKLSKSAAKEKLLKYPDSKLNSNNVDRFLENCLKDTDFLNQ